VIGVALSDHSGPKKGGSEEFVIKGKSRDIMGRRVPKDWKWQWRKKSRRVVIFFYVVVFRISILEIAKS